MPGIAYLVLTIKGCSTKEHLNKFPSRAVSMVTNLSEGPWRVLTNLQCTSFSVKFMQLYTNHQNIPCTFVNLLNKSFWRQYLSAKHCCLNRITLLYIIVWQMYYISEIRVHSGTEVLCICQLTNVTWEDGWEQFL